MAKLAIIQARMGSSRLPGKVLMDLAGQPLLSWTVSGAKAISQIDQVVVATTTEPGDDAIFNWCQEQSIACVRGPENDVLKRYILAAEAYNGSILMRLTSDCPFLDPHICSQLLLLHELTGSDYTTNTQPPSWPDGLDCEVFSFHSLQKADQETQLASDREHVTPYLYKSHERFKVHNMYCPIEGLAQERWCVDDEVDFERAVEVAQVIKPGSPFVDTLYAYRSLNANQDDKLQSRNEGYSSSLKAEPIVPHYSYDQSQALLQQALQTIPLAAQTFSKSHIQFPEGFAPLFASHGVGGKLWDVDGRDYVDLIMGLLPLVLGYCDSDVDNAVRRQLDKGTTFSLSSSLECQLAELICDIVPCAEQVRYGKNGSDATAGAIRIARAYTGRERVIACGYHGWQDWYIGATSRNKGVPKATSALTHMVPYNDLDAIQSLFDQYPNEIAALIMEPMNIMNPEDGYLEGVRDLVHKHDAVFIFDEVITGFRFSLGGAQELFSVTPDLTCFGKGMANGLPLSAVVGHKDLMQLNEEIFFSSTNGGEALSLAGAIATISKIRDKNVPENIKLKGQILTDHVEKVSKDHNLENVIGLSGHPSWKILKISDHQNASAAAIKTLFIKEMISRGVLLNASHNMSYAHSGQDLARVKQAYDECLAIIAQALKEDTLRDLLDCPIIEPVFKVR